MGQAREQDGGDLLNVESMLNKALVRPMTTEERLAEVDRVIATVQGQGLIGGQDATELQSLIAVGQAYERFAHYNRALSTFQTALNLAAELKDKTTHAMVLRHIGCTNVLARRWDEALNYLQQSESEMQKLGDESERAETIRQRGVMHHERGQFDEAGAAFQEAAEISRVIDDDRAVAGATDDLAALSLVQGKLDEAISLFGQCASIYHRLGDAVNTARAYHSLGVSYADAGNWHLSLENLERSFQIAEPEGLQDLMANIYLCRAVVYLELKDTMMAAPCCTRALEIYKNGGNVLGEANTYRLLGLVFTVREQWQMAFALFDQSEDLNRKLDNQLGLAEAVRDRGRALCVQGDTESARASLETALGSFRSLHAVAAAERVDRQLKQLASDG